MHQIRWTHRGIAGLALVAAVIATGLGWAHDAKADDGILARGYLPGTFGLRFGPDGLLYVPTGAGIVVLHPDTGQITGMLGPAQGVFPPEDVNFGPDGSMYWSVMFSGEVGRRAPDGSITTQMLGPGVNPIAFSPTGRMFVSEPWFTDILVELDPALQLPPRPIAQGLGGVKGTDWGADGKLYAALMRASKVVRIDVDSGAVETVADGIPAPFTAKFGPDGLLYVVERASFSILAVDPDTGASSVHAQLPFGPDNIAFAPDGRLFVSSYTDGTVAEVLPGGGLRVLAPGGLTVPGGIAVKARPDGESVFVASLFALWEFDGASGAVRGVTRSHMTPAGYGGSISVGNAGDDLVLTTFFPTARVQVWDPASSAVKEDRTDFITPQNAIGFDGDLVVADLGLAAGQARVLRVGAGGSTVLADAADQIFVPLGLAATADDLWVGDWATGVIWQLVADGAELPQPMPVAQGLAGPEGMAVDVDGTLLVVEGTAGRLSRVDPRTGSVRPVAGGLALSTPGFGILPPFGFLTGVAVGPSGAIYVVGDSGNLVYRIEPRTTYLVGAANTAGFSGSAWTSDLQFHNRGTTQAGILVELLAEGADNRTPASATLMLGPGLSSRVVNVLGSLFSFTGSAALRVTSTGGDVLASMRTWTPCGSGGCGQLTLGIDAASATAAGTVTVLAQLENTRTHRTNLGVVNTSGGAMHAEVHLFMADGTAIGQRDFDLLPYGFLQANDVFHSLDTLQLSALQLESIADAYAEVTSTTAGASFLAYASVVDNATNDAICIPGR